jgi:hypothetical protein
MFGSFVKDIDNRNVKEIGERKLKREREREMDGGGRDGGMLISRNPQRNLPIQRRKARSKSVLDLIIFI